MLLGELTLTWRIGPVLGANPAIEVRSSVETAAVNFIVKVADLYDGIQFSSNSAVSKMLLRIFKNSI
jgi:hypothetical protein